MKALIQVYDEEEANKINEEWIGCSSEIEIENEIVIFKEALYLGYDLADVFLIEDRKYMLGNFKRLEKNYGKEGASIIVDNCQDTLFGGLHLIQKQRK